MIRLSRDHLLALGLLVVLVIVTFITGFRKPGDEQPPPYASFSSTPNGAHALMLWLQALGYTVSNASDDAFVLPKDVAVTLMLEPTQLVSSGEWRTIDKWVEGGGTLVLAGDGFSTAQAVEHFKFVLRSQVTATDKLTLQTPLMVLPPVIAAADVRAVGYLEPHRDDYVVHLASDRHPVLVSFSQGTGRVFLSVAPFPFSNLGLKQEGNPPLVLNLITASSHAGMVWFDEWHHGVRGTGAEGTSNLQEWLFTTATGHSLLFTAVVIFVALILQGRRFGRPLPLPRDLTRRAPLEYITAIANLHRRAGHRSAILIQYYHRLKRELGHRYRLSAALDDDEFVRRLSGFRPDIDAASLRALLAKLQQRSPGEADLIQLAAQVADWLHNYSSGPAI